MGVRDPQPLSGDGERRRTPVGIWIAVGCAGCFVLLFCSGILAAIAIPNLLRARIAANESAALGRMRTIASAQAVAQQQAIVDANGDGVGEFLTAAQLDESGAYAIEPPLSTQPYHGYRYVITVGSEGQTWYATAVPETYMSSGTRTFYVNESGVIRGRDLEGRAPATRAEGERFPLIGG